MRRLSFHIKTGFRSPVRLLPRGTGPAGRNEGRQSCFASTSVLPGGLMLGHGRRLSSISLHRQALPQGPVSIRVGSSSSPRRLLGCSLIPLTPKSRPCHRADGCPDLPIVAGREGRPHQQTEETRIQKPETRIQSYGPGRERRTRNAKPETKPGQMSKVKVPGLLLQPRESRQSRERAGGHHVVVFRPQAGLAGFVHRCIGGLVHRTTRTATSDSGQR